MCLADEDTMDYLLLNCKVAQGLWFAVLSWFGCGGFFLEPSLRFLRLGTWQLAEIEEGPRGGQHFWVSHGLLFGRKEMRDGLRI